MFGAFALLVAAGTASAHHAGTEIDDVEPRAFTPGDVVTLNLSEAQGSPDDPLYLANEIVVHAPVVDGTQLTFDANATEQQAQGNSNWLLVGSSDDRLRYRWNTSQGLPSPPDTLDVEIDEGLGAFEGEALWKAEFCTRVDETRHCPEGHNDTATNVYDNLEPATSFGVEDGSGHTSPPFLQNATVTLNATDGGSGVETIRWAPTGGSARDYNGSIHLDAPGRYNVTFWAVDRVGHQTAPVGVPVTVVAGHLFTGVPADVTAGAPFDVEVRIVSNLSTADPIASASYPVNLSLADGPGPLRGAGVQNATAGFAVFEDLQLDRTGTVRLNASVPNLGNVTSSPVTVRPAALDRIEVSPATPKVKVNGSVSFTAAGSDSFGNAVPVSPSWSATCGTIDASGAYTAPPTADTCHVQAVQSGVTGGAKVTVVNPGSSSGSQSADPTKIVDVSSASHAVDGWSNGSTVRLTWSVEGPGDVAGFSYTFARDPSDPDGSAETDAAQVDLPVEGDGSYTFRVRAVLSDGSAGPVAEIGPIHVDTKPPAAPDGISTAVQSGGVNVAWSEVTADDGSPVTSYRVHRAAGDGSFEVVGSDVSQPPYRDDDVAGGTTYRYRVTAVDAAGNEGPASQTGSATVPSEGGGTGSVGDDSSDGASGADEAGNTTYRRLYDLLGLSNATSLEAVDEDGDGVLDDLTRDDRIRVARTTSIGNRTALLVAHGDRDPQAILVPATDTVLPLEVRHLEPDKVVQTRSGRIAPVQLDGTDGWTLVHVADPASDRPLDRVVRDGDTEISEDRLWRTNDTVTFLTDTGGRFDLQYGGAAAGSADAGASVPGPSALLAAVAGAAAAWVLRRD